MDWIDILKDKFEHPAIVLWRAVELRHIEKSLKGHKLNSPLLDLGCAEGKIAELLFKGQSLIGLDNCWELIRNNRERTAYKALILADACRLPYKNAVLGSVFSNCVIEHIPDLDAVLGEVSRTLENKGVFLFTVPSHKFGDFLCFSTIFNNLGLGKVAHWYKKKRNKLLNHFHCYDHNTWTKILSDKGFRLLEHRYYMVRKATFIWDLLAACVFIIRPICPAGFLKVINRQLTDFLRPYYTMDSEIGSGLLLVAEKGV